MRPSVRELKARIEDLEEALVPFAESARCINPGMSGDTPLSSIEEDPDGRCIVLRVSHLRAAQDAMSEVP